MAEWKFRLLPRVLRFEKRSSRKNLLNDQCVPAAPIRCVPSKVERSLPAESKSAPPGIEITGIVLGLKSGIHSPAEPRLHSSIRWQAVGRVFVCPRRSAENCDRCSDLDSMEECNRQLFGHPHATMRCRITGEIPRVHSISFMEAHEVTHGRGHEFATARHFHVDIGVGDNGVAIRVHDLPVDA